MLTCMKSNSLMEHNLRVSDNVRAAGRWMKSRYQSPTGRTCQVHGERRSVTTVESNFTTVLVPVPARTDAN